VETWVLSGLLTVYVAVPYHRRVPVV
jgi:hypothetical protein